MDFNNQINELATKAHANAAKIDALKTLQAGLRSDNGRVRRMYNAIVENEIVYDDAIGNKKLKLSDLLKGIVEDKENDIANMQDEVNVLSADAKKFNKAIETLEALNETVLPTAV